MAFKKLKDMFSSSSEGNFEGDEYLEIDLDQERKENKVLVKLFSLKDYDDTKDILDALREGYTIAVIDIKTLKKKDPIELKRAVSKIKKTADALEGKIAGFGDGTIIIAPSFAKIEKHVSAPKEEKRFSDDF